MKDSSPTPELINITQRLSSDVHPGDSEYEEEKPQKVYEYEYYYEDNTKPAAPTTSNLKQPQSAISLKAAASSKPPPSKVAQQQSIGKIRGNQSALSAKLGGGHHDYYGSDAGFAASSGALKIKTGEYCLLPDLC